MKNIGRKLAGITLALTLMLSTSVSAYGATFYYGKTPLKYRMTALEELIVEVQENYKDRVELDTLFTGIFQGLFESLGDRWSVYYPPSEKAAALLTSVDGEYEGIGIAMRKTSNGILITATVYGSPAYKAGLTSGDYIIQVNNTSVEDMTAEDVSILIKGEPGTSVTLTVNRDGVNKLFTVTRTVIKTDTVSYKLLDGGVGYIDIETFESDTADVFAKAREALLAQGMTSLIIDLRGNGGGLMNAALEVADQLIPTAGVIAYFERQGQIIETIRSTANSIKQVETVVLVDGETASASECLVGALKDRNVATIVGTTTYGKGVAQTVASAGNGAALKLSIYYFNTPDGFHIDGNGIAPDVAVYNGSEKTDEEIAAIKKTLAPMSEKTKYFAGGVGLNVYAAQQRLSYLGYDVDITGIMDEKAVAAIKKFQGDVGGYPYGGLDFSTMSALNTAFDSWLSPVTEDLQLQSALKLLNK